MIVHLLLLLSTLRLAGGTDTTTATDADEHDNWAVLVDTSRYYSNYRHSSNTLAIYDNLKRLGMPDDRIILMLAEDVCCGARTPLPGEIFYDAGDRAGSQVVWPDIEVDYRGEEVTVDNVLRLFTGRHHATTPRNKRLLATERSNVFVYFTGHSGDEFIKFQDFEEISSMDFRISFQQMATQRRFRGMLWMSDTCQAASLQNQFISPGILAIGSSKRGQNSISYRFSEALGVSNTDRFTFVITQWMKENLRDREAQGTVGDMMRPIDPSFLESNPQLRRDLWDYAESCRKAALSGDGHFDHGQYRTCTEEAHTVREDMMIDVKALLRASGYDIGQPGSWRRYAADSAEEVAQQSIIFARWSRDTFRSLGEKFGFLPKPKVQKERPPSLEGLPRLTEFVAGSSQIWLSRLAQKSQSQSPPRIAAHDLRHLHSLGDRIALGAGKSNWHKARDDPSASSFAQDESQSRMVRRCGAVIALWVLLMRAWPSR